MKTRLDAELVRRGLARSRDHAADLILAVVINLPEPWTLSLKLKYLVDEL